MRHTIDLREPPTDLPALDFHLTDTDRANAKVDMAAIYRQRDALNERDERKE